MAYCNTTQKPVSTYPYFTLTVTEDTSYTNKKTTAKLDWSLTYHADYAVSSGAHGICRAIINGEKKDKDYTYGGKTGTNNVNSGSVYVTRSTSSKTVSFSIWAEWDVSYSGYSYSALTGSGSITISAKTSYTVSYNANGGSGAPGSQTKYAGTDLTLSSTKPTRTGYTFSKWNTNSSGTGTNYDPGSAYKTDAGATLYAQWIPNTYPVTYNNNGGTGAIASQTKTYDVTLKLSSTIPSKSLYNFVTWNTNASGSGTNYSPGDNYTTNAALTLYAIWEKAISPPIISGIVIQRCTDSTGSVIDEYNGKYAKIQFNWSCDQLPGNNPVTSITINGTAVASSGGTFSGSVTEVRGQFSADTSHNIEIVVTDSYGLSTAVNRSLTSAKYAIDFKAGGTGVAFGKVAIESNRLDSAWPGYFNGLYSRRSFDGALIDLSYADILTDWDLSYGANGWNFVKYNNGLVHLFGEFELGAANNFTWSTITRNSTIISYFTSPFNLPTLPFDIKKAHVNANFSNYSFWCSLYSQPGNNFGNVINVRANSIVDYTNASNVLVIDVDVWGIYDTTSGDVGTGDYNIVSVDNGNGTQTLHITDATSGDVGTGDYNIVSIDNGNGTQTLHITDAI